MSLVLDALGKAKQQSDMARAGADPAQLHIMTGGGGSGRSGGAPLPSAGSRAGVLIGTAVAVAGVMLALAVVVVGYMLKPAPQSAAAAPPPPEVAIAAAPSQPAPPMEPIPGAIRGVEASPDAAILSVQPFLNELMEKEPAAIAAVEPPVVADSVIENAKPQAAAAPVAPAAQTPPVITPAAPPAPPKPMLQPGVEYVQTLDVADAPAVKLGAIVWSDALKVALINGATMQTGDTIQAVRLVDIEPKRVKLEHGGRQFWLRLP